MSSHMDFSNYPEEHHLHNKSNQNELGFWKDELCGMSDCLEFVGLRSKSYALLLKKKTMLNLKRKKFAKVLVEKLLKQAQIF